MKHKKDKKQVGVKVMDVKVMGIKGRMQQGHCYKQVLQ